MSGDKMGERAELDISRLREAIADSQAILEFQKAVASLPGSTQAGARQNPPKNVSDALRRLDGNVTFLLEAVEFVGEAGLQRAIDEAGITDASVLDAFRNSERTKGGVLPMLRSELSQNWRSVSAGQDLGIDEPMILANSSLGCLGAKIAIAGGAGLMTMGMVTENPGAFTEGAVALGLGMAGAKAFC